MSLPAFHLAFPIKSIADTRAFYIDILGCAEGRSTEAWIDFDFFGHQLSAHVRPEAGQNAGSGTVDGDAVPIPHFGAVLEWEKWHDLADRLKAAKVPFLLEPKIRFEGEPGEQGTFFVSDPAGNGLEFKTFRDPAMILNSSPLPAAGTKTRPQPTRPTSCTSPDRHRQR